MSAVNPTTWFGFFLIKFDYKSLINVRVPSGMLQCIKLNRKGVGYEANNYAYHK